MSSLRSRRTSLRLTMTTTGSFFKPRNSLTAQPASCSSILIRSGYLSMPMSELLYSRLVHCTPLYHCLHGPSPIFFIHFLSVAVMLVFRPFLVRTLFCFLFHSFDSLHSLSNPAFCWSKYLRLQDACISVLLISLGQGFVRIILTFNIGRSRSVKMSCSLHGVS